MTIEQLRDKIELWLAQAEEQENVANLRARQCRDALHGLRFPDWSEAQESRQFILDVLEGEPLEE